MAGNSRRHGAVRKSGTKKGAVVGSGGQRRRGLEGKGPTPKAVDRAGHPAQKRAGTPSHGAPGPAAQQRQSAQQHQSGQRSGQRQPGHGQPAPRKAGQGQSGHGQFGQGQSAQRKSGQRQPVQRQSGYGHRRGPDAGSAPETVAGRNPVLECLRAGVPAKALHVAVGVDADDRVTESVRRAADAGIPILEVPRADLDRMTGGVLHQGLALTVPPYEYAQFDDVLTAAHQAADAALLVALDGVTDPRNLGAVVRSAAAFGAHGVLLPQRRSAGITAVAWRTSAGTATRLPVARVANLTRALRDAASAGLTVVGLDADGTTSIDELAVASEPLVIVAGGEGRGLSRLVRQTCDLAVSIPMASAVESLNAAVAAGVVLAEVARRRRQAAAPFRVDGPFAQ